MVKEIPKIEDPWVMEYNLLIQELKKLKIPGVGSTNPDWARIRGSIKHYGGLLHYKAMIRLYKLFDRVHPKFAPPKPFSKETK